VFLPLPVVFCRAQAAGLEADPNDVILLTKEWVCSEHLSQKPLCVLPNSFLSRLPPISDITVAGRNELPERQGCC
jgi:hypothetical protein